MWALAGHVDLAQTTVLLDRAGCVSAEVMNQSLLLAVEMLLLLPAYGPRLDYPTHEDKISEVRITGNGGCDSGGAWKGVSKERGWPENVSGSGTPETARSSDSAGLVEEDSSWVPAGLSGNVLVGG